MLTRLIRRAMEGEKIKTDKRFPVMGIPLLDKQHTEYADLVDRLFKLAERGSVSRETLSRETNAVIKYAGEHFDTEEYLMRSQKYPAYAEHLSKHNTFRDWTDTLILDLEGDIDLDGYTITLSKWLIEWFYDQVQTDDQKLAVFLKNDPLFRMI